MHAVTVAGGDDGDLRVARGASSRRRNRRVSPRGTRRTAITELVEGHHRLQAQLRGAHVLERRGAVERQPRPHPVAARRNIAEHAGGVGDAGLVVEAARRIPKAQQLFARDALVALVGAREVRHQAQLARRRAERPDARQRCGELARRKAQPVHAGVDLDPQHEAVGVAGALQQLDLAGIVHHQIEALVALRPRAALPLNTPSSSTMRLLSPAARSARPSSSRATAKASASAQRTAPRAPARARRRWP